MHHRTESASNSADADKPIVWTARSSERKATSDCGRYLITYGSITTYVNNTPNKRNWFNAWHVGDGERKHLGASVDKEAVKKLCEQHKRATA